MKTKTVRTPKYVGIKDWLFKGILNGDFPANSLLPSEHDLAERFGVSRITVRQALDMLRATSLVRSRQGKGYIVCPLSAVQDLGRLQGFGEMMEPLGVITRSEILDTSVVTANGRIAKALEIKRGDDVVRIERVRIAAESAMSIDISYFPMDVGEPLLTLDLKNVDIFKLIESQLDLSIGFADIAMQVVPAEPPICGHLSIAAGQPVIHIERLTRTIACRPIDFEDLYASPDSHRFKVRIPRW